MNDVSQSAVILKPAASAQSFDFDVTIVGAGPVGLALAGWRSRRSATHALKIALVDAREPEDSIADPRAIAVSHGSRMILEPLNWPADATAIERIHVSQRGHFGRTLIDQREHGLPALGYVLRYGSIVHGLAQAVHATPVHWFRSTSAAAPTQEHDGVTLPIETAGVTRHLRSRILVNAEGGLFGDQKKAGKSAAACDTRDYGQTALVGTVSASAPQPHVAWERFTSQGPIALLPMGGVRGADYALVWCCAP
jgi:2-octaprenyl-6-methoxyphenol hydroxylase